LLQVWISNLTVHGAVDAIVREFEHGAVLLNPSLSAYTFDLSTLFPGKQFRRLKGSAKQDPVVNNGQAVGASVVMPAGDGLFLIKQ